MYTLLSTAIATLAGCNQAAAPTQTPAAAGTAPAPAQSTAGAQAAYTPPTADQLYQMVAPIALFPDKLVAQVLAGATYPDQITAADNEVTQNPNLTGASLQTAIAQQPWDASVKGLTAFPSVLDQMAKNIEWTTALGDAYVNDPTDVMNAIQVMRQRASKKGNLRSSAQLNVTTQAESAPPPSYADTSEGGYPVYSGQAVVPPPEQIIEIAPAQPDTVYVPQYDPQTVYGQDVPYYPGYSYASPQGYSTGEVVAVGALSFGAAILIGNLFEHHHDDHQNYGWNNWGMNWGGGRGGNGNYDGNRGWQRPAVVYNNNTYVSRSTTVVNHYVTNNRTTINNINNSSNRIVQNRYAGQPAANQPMNRAAVGPMNGRPGEAAPRGAASLPHFGPGGTERALPAAGVAAGAAAAAAAARAHAPGNAGVPMSMPHFAANPQRGEPPAHAPNNPERGPAAHAPAAEKPARPMEAPRQQPVQHPMEAAHPQPAAARRMEAPRQQPAAPHPIEAPRAQPAAPRPMQAPRPQPQPQPQQRPAAAPHPQPASHKPAPAHPNDKKDKDHQ
ncbi:DUF3300 domain-containing protein [Rhodanobacter sp. C01]|uniref:DUF3300 domain-containing protein n=1 Tax=Rhodanobacter sp. C01 TaxID=1945856 RepID=UPI0009C7670F|nr:DUF3300 domain-containing protein [Rhodanobacter sp. C01]OOG46023.1 hypothetical protein B0E50_15330 [Rhodanobacter sp. C01]